jgi:hypothetical protein
MPCMRGVLGRGPGEGIATCIPRWIKSRSPVGPYRRYAAENPDEAPDGGCGLWLTAESG